MHALFKQNNDRLSVALRSCTQCSVELRRSQLRGEAGQRAGTAGVAADGGGGRESGLDAWYPWEQGDGTWDDPGYWKPGPAA